MLDFGIARFFENNDPSATRSGRAIGTPAFMAPEQAMGRLREIDGRTDLWALGATIFSLLSGRFVHESEGSGEMLIFAATRPARPLKSLCPEIPEPLCAVIDQALAFEKKARWKDAAAMSDALCAAFQVSFARQLVELDPPEVPMSARLDDLHSIATDRGDLHSLLTDPPARSAGREQLALAPALETSLPLRRTEPSPSALPPNTDGVAALARTPESPAQLRVAPTIALSNSSSPQQPTTALRGSGDRALNGENQTTTGSVVASAAAYGRFARLAILSRYALAAFVGGAAVTAAITVSLSAFKSRKSGAVVAAGVNEPDPASIDLAAISAPDIPPAAVAEYRAACSSGVMLRAWIRWLVSHQPPVQPRTLRPRTCGTCWPPGA